MNVMRLLIVLVLFLFVTACGKAGNPERPQGNHPFPRTYPAQ